MYPNFSEFGLYRYDNSGKRYAKNGRLFSSIIIYSILAMTVIFGGLLYVFFSGRFSEISSNNSQRIAKNSTQTKKYEIHSKNATTDTNVGLEVIEISRKNFTESHAKRIKRLDSEDDSRNDTSPDSQKLTLFPTRSLKPPRIVQKPKVVYSPSLPPNHKISSRRIDPYGYQFGALQPRPHEFLKPPTARSFYGNHQFGNNNIQDIINQNYHNNYHTAASQLLTSATEMMGANPVQLAGTYRHPRTQGNLAQIFQQAKPQSLKADTSDPFRNFKPASPHEVNQMINQHINDEHDKYMGTTTSDAPYFRRKFKQKIASVPNYNNHASNAVNLYGNVMKMSKKRVQDRNEIQQPQQQQGKPFSVMLDVYPVPGEENDFVPTLHHMPNLKRFKPMLLNRYYQDPQMFNGINYPQVLARYPAYFRYPNNPKQQQQHQQQASTNYGMIQSNGMMQGNGMLKPSQLVVHLNLYPKNNVPTFKRSSSEDGNSVKQQDFQQRPTKINLLNSKNQTIDVSSTPFNINFNVHTGNGHPENIAHQKQLEFNRTSTEATMPQNYFYEDEDEDDGGDQNINIHPSLVYKDIYRDRPIHLMLKNTTVNTTRRPRNGTPNSSKYEKFEKSKNLKFHYLTIDRPKAKYSSVIKPKVFGPFY